MSQVGFSLLCCCCFRFASQRPRVLHLRLCRYLVLEARFRSERNAMKSATDVSGWFLSSLLLLLPICLAEAQSAAPAFVSVSGVGSQVQIGKECHEKRY